MAKHPISEEDKALFRAQMREVKPLQTKTKRASSPDLKPLQVKSEQNHKVTSSPTNRHLSDFIQETINSETILSYSTPGLTNKRFNELKRGTIPWESKLDLHGLGVETARESLINFIQAQSQNGKRCLLIIHGKGGHQGKPPVIKNQINRWLPQFEEVMAFYSAKPKDGGLGAVYVLLKR